MTKQNIRQLIKLILTKLQSLYAEPHEKEQAAWWLLEAITKKSKAQLLALKTIHLSDTQQAQLNEVTDLTGLVLTKMDGTGSGGILVSISKELEIPVCYISFGEQLDHIKAFNAQEYVQELLSE